MCNKNESKEKNRVQALALLRKDLINGPHATALAFICTAVQISAQQSEIYKYSNRRPHSNPHRNRHVLQAIPKMGKFMMTMSMISILEVTRTPTIIIVSVKIKFKFYFHRTIVVN